VTPFSSGETITTEYANYVGDHLFRDEPRGIYRHVPVAAGTLPPNPWGLYDMHGNLWEFCADRWHDDYSGAPFNGEAWELTGGSPAGQDWRVARGGSWHEPPANCRSATRLRVLETERDDYYGFRLVVTL
jgi:formylglycine-generating enzyme required for sulfatase activity